MNNINKDMLRKAFFARYDDQWDYAHNMLQRGFSYINFCKKNDLELPEKVPVHFKDIPEKQQDAYKTYIAEQIAIIWDESPEYVKKNYVLADAIAAAKDEISKNEVLNLDVTIAKFIVPRLQLFMEEEDSYPEYDLLILKKTGQRVPLSAEEYRNVLQEMIDGFNEKIIHDIADVDMKKVNRALELFCCYYNSLWI